MKIFTVLVFFLLCLGLSQGAQKARGKCDGSTPEYRFLIETGDTLSGISYEFFGSVRKVNFLAERNGIENTERIFAGDNIIVPCMAEASVVEVSVSEVKSFELPTTLTEKGWTGAPSFASFESPMINAVSILSPAMRFSPLRFKKWGERSADGKTPEILSAQSKKPVLEPKGSSSFQPRRGERVQKNLNPEKGKGRKVMRIATSPFKAAVWPFKNPKKVGTKVMRNAGRYGGMALGFNPDPITRFAGVGALMILSAFTAPPADARSLIFASAVASEAKVSPPSRAEVEAAGKVPQLRYTVPEGELKWVSSSIFQQPPYNEKNREAIEALPRGTAEELGLVGARVRNEWVGSGVAPEVILDKNAVVAYQQTPEGIVLLYLFDCRYNGNPWANRIKLVSPPPAMQTQITPPQPAQQPAMAYANATAPAVNIPAFPGRVDLNLNGLPAETKVTYHVINETRSETPKLHWSQVGLNLGKTMFYGGVGYGAAHASHSIPNAWKSVARENASAVRYKSDRDLEAAKAKAAADVIVSENIKVGMQTRNPDTVDVNVSNTGVNNPQNRVVSDNTVSPTISPVNTANPTNNSSIDNRPVNNAQGGRGGEGGHGGSGGQGGAGGVGNGGEGGDGGNPVANGGDAVNNGGSNVVEVDTNVDVDNSANNGNKIDVDAEGGKVQNSGNSRVENQPKVDVNVENQPKVNVENQPKVDVEVKPGDKDDHGGGYGGGNDHDKDKGGHKP